MQKKNLVATCMAIPGGILFAIGMCMALLPEWNMFIPGVIVGGVGAITLILIFPVYRKVGKYPPIKKDFKNIFPIIVGVVACLLLGIGMSFVMVPKTPEAWQIITGMGIGVVGLIAIILNPIISISNKKAE